MKIGSVYNPKRGKEQTTPTCSRNKQLLRAQPKKQTKWHLEAGKENFNANIPSGSRRVLLNRMRLCMYVQMEFERGTVRKWKVPTNRNLMPNLMPICCTFFIVVVDKIGRKSIGLKKATRTPLL